MQVINKPSHFMVSAFNAPIREPSDAHADQQPLWQYGPQNP